MDQRFILLEEAVIQVIRLFSFLWLWFSSCLPSDGEGYETYWSFLMEETDWGGNWVLFYWAGSCFSSVAQSCLTLCNPMNRSTPGLPVHHNSRSLLKLMSIESLMPSYHLILCRPLLLLPAIPPSIRVFSSESTLHMRWPKYWSFSFSISPSNEHPGLILGNC